MSLTLVLGIATVVLLPFAISGGETVKSSDWIGFAGSAISGGVSLFAAVIAWIAVQKQIKAQFKILETAEQQRLRQKEVAQEEAKFAASIVLTQTVHAAAAICLIGTGIIHLRERKDGNAAEISDQIIVLQEDHRNAMRALKAVMSHFAIAEVWKQLSANDQAGYLVVSSTLHTLVTLHDNLGKIDAFLAIRNQLETFRQLQTYLRAFDPMLADIFVRDSRR